jgi:phospholipase B1
LALIGTDRHELRPENVQVIGAIGDSITAGFGAKAENLLQLANEYQGVSWLIGGDESVETVFTLANGAPDPFRLPAPPIAAESNGPLI